MFYVKSILSLSSRLRIFYHLTTTSLFLKIVRLLAPIFNWWPAEYKVMLDLVAVLQHTGVMCYFVMVSVVLASGILWLLSAEDSAILLSLGMISEP